jgi:hypothetical protein
MLVSRCWSRWFSSGGLIMGEVNRSSLGRGSLVWAIAIAAIVMAYLPARGANMLVRYSFDEAASGTATANNSGTLGATFNGTFNGTATRVSTTPLNYSLGAADLNGGGINNSVTSTADIGPLTKFTVSTWVNVRSQTDGGGFRVFGGDLFSNPPGHGWFLYFLPEATKVQRLGVEVDNGANTATATVDAFNKWLFVAATWDQTATGSELRFYAGTPTSGVTQVGSAVALTTSMTASANARFRVGGYSSNPGTSPDSWVDDFRVYDDVLSLANLETVRLENVPEPAAAGVIALAGLAASLRRRR